VEEVPHSLKSNFSRRFVDEAGFKVRESQVGAEEHISDWTGKPSSGEKICDNAAD
jgi:hypothetical protein